MHRELAAAAALLLLVALPASAATVVLPDGTTSKLEESQEVTGPASVYAEGGQGRIQLHEGAVLRVLKSTTDEKGNVTEHFFLKSGACDADLGFFARIATTAFWAFSDSAEGSRISCRFEALGERRAHARAAAGSGLVRLVVSTAPHGITEAQIQAGQGVAIHKESSGLRFRTDWDNVGKAGSVRVLVARPAGAPYDLYVPKATEGAVLPGGEGRMVVVNGISSWRVGVISCVLPGTDGTEGSALLGAGTAIAVQVASGAVSETTDAEVAAAAPIRVLSSAATEKGGTLPLELPFKVLVKDLRLLKDEDTQRTTAAALWLENQGAAHGPLPLEVVFLYSGPKGSIAAVTPCFVPAESPELKERGSWFTEVKPGDGECGSRRVDDLLLDQAQFVRVLALSGAESPAVAASVNAKVGPRRGTRFLGGAVEVVEAKSDLAGPKPALSFTIRNVAPPFVPMPDEKDPFDPVGELRVRVRLYRDGQALDLGAEFDAPRAIGALGVRGEKLSFRIEVPAEKLAGAWPVLTLSR